MASRQPFQQNPKPKTSIILLAITISASLIILFAILYIIYFLWYSLIHRSRTSPFDSSTPLNKLQRFNYKDLKNATHNFTSSNYIGKGGSGTVFRGILKDGKLVAVKLLDPSSFQSENEFQNELMILGGLKSCPFVVSLLGFCVEKGKRFVVYEYMPNRTLQESLFFDSNSGGCNNLSLDWVKRFAIVLDIANALSFLHLECDPPVIHGDVKPSNVLLDSEFRAKISDFGLSRLKLEGEFGIDLFRQDLWKSQEIETSTIRTPHENDEVDFALALQASSSSKNSCKIYHNVMGLSISSFNFNFKSGGGDDNDLDDDTNGKKLKGKELSISENNEEDWNKFVPYDDELCSIDHSKELSPISAVVNEEDINKVNVEAKQWGKDWWWKQDGSGELCSKDYVKEWIGSQISPSVNPHWDEENLTIHENSNLDNSMILDKFVEVNENPVQEPQHDDVIEKEDSNKWNVQFKKHRKMHEWWKEENLNELSKKSHKARLQVWSKKRFKVPHFSLAKNFQFRRRNSFQQSYNKDDQNKELSSKKGWKKKNRKNSRSMESDIWSGDLFSRELSSTTSMRGTLCYVAPEYGNCGSLMEKADIYSLGVLILVIVSGRRPLHILSSPMKLEKANLISWARHLAHKGNILELVDERIKDEYNKEQASLCINLALACLQKMPELRPDIGDIVKILKGEMELPSLPFEFSPSPPSRWFNRSGRKQKSSSADCTV